MYSGYRIIFDSVGSWNFDCNIARNVTNFIVDISSSFHVHNHNNIILVLNESTIARINDEYGLRDEKNSIKFSKANQIICLKC